ncbi:probable ATP-dependent DNA helicase RecS [Clytia hemisphaerica]
MAAAAVTKLESLRNFCNGLTGFELKYKQLEAVDSILMGKDTLCILPTGFGKSLIYQILPACVKKFRPDIKNPLVVVISPLVALIKDQVQSCNTNQTLGLKASSLEFSKISQISKGEFNILFGTPESFVQQKHWRDMLGSTYFIKNLVCLVVDEAHKVVWGEADFGKEPFRKSFKQINELRSICRINLPVLALSATVNVDITDLIKSSCNLSRTVNIISESVDRKNIKLNIINLETKSADCLFWVLEGLKEYGRDAPKIIIYCRTVDMIGWLYDELLVSNILSAEDVRKRFKIFHSSSFEDEKNIILDALVKETDIRVIISTSALGCGINAKGVVFVIHFGPAFDTVDYAQQIGRAGRNVANMCNVIMYTYPGCKSGNVSDKMKSYIDQVKLGCLRTALFSPLNPSGYNVLPLSPLHDCCSYCASKCYCVGDGQTPCHLLSAPQFLPPKPIQTGPSHVIFREVSLDDEDLVRELMLENSERLQDASPGTSIFPAELISGLTLDVIDNVILNLKYISTKEFILESTMVNNERLAHEIMVILFEVFNDIPDPGLYDKNLENFGNHFSKQFVFSNDSSHSSSSDDDFFSLDD